MKRWFSLIVIGMMILSGCTQQAEQKENPSSEAEPKEESVQEEELIIGLSKPMPDRVEYYRKLRRNSKKSMISTALC